MSSLLFAGLTTLDLIHYAPSLPVAGTKGTAELSVLDVGGPAANAAITAALLGGDVALATVLGDDALAHYARRAVVAQGIRLREVAADGALPVASVWVDGVGERTVLSTDNRTLAVDDPAERLVCTGTEAVLLDGHYPNVQLSVAREAAAVGVPIVLDCGRWREVFADLLPLASDAILSAGFRIPGVEELSGQETVAAASAAYDLEFCAITNGSEPIWAVSAEGLTSVDVPQVEVVDTLGAGDVLHGAYVFHRYQGGMSPLQAIAEAAVAASSSCQNYGVRN